MLPPSRCQPHGAPALAPAAARVATTNIAAFPCTSRCSPARWELHQAPEIGRCAAASSEGCRGMAQETQADPGRLGWF